MWVERPDGQTLYATAVGRGERTLVMQGGWIGSGELWAQVVEQLPGWRCVAFDHRGSGESPADPGMLTPQVLVDDLFAVMDAYGVGSAVVAAESQGTLIALLAALQAPERVEGLVLVGGRARWPQRDDPDEFADWLQRDHESALRWFVDLCLPEADSEHLARWGLDVLRRADVACAVALLGLGAGIDLTDTLSSLTMPSLVVHGALDAVVALDDGRAMAAELPDAHLVVLDDAGHVPTVSRPTEVAAAIRGRFASP